MAGRNWTAQRVAWGLGILVALVSLTSGIFQIFGVTVKDLIARAPEATATEISGPLKIVPMPGATAPAPVDAAIASIASRIGPVGEQQRDMLVFDVNWTGGRAAALKFDARHFYVLRFERSGQACAISVPVIHAWGPPAESGRRGARTAQRTLALRLPSERLEAEALAGRLGISDARVDDCNALAARVEDGGRSVAQHKARCAGSYEDIAREAWTALADSHEAARTDGLAIRTTGLYAPPAVVADVQSKLESGRFCAGGDLAAQLTEGLVSR